MPAVTVYPTDTEVLIDEAGAVAVESGAVVSVTAIWTLCADVVSVPSVTVYVNVSPYVPVLLGVYVNRPVALLDTVAVPPVACAERAKVRVPLLV